MKIRRFVAKDMRTALTQIKEELGVDAVIMSNKKIPEGVELMAAVDYNQAVPPAKFPEKRAVETEAQQNSLSPREVSNDVVSLGQQTQRHNNTSSSSTSTSSSSVVNDNSAEDVPADSLSALLNRQVQHPAQYQSSHQTAQQQEPNSLDKTTIKQQLKSFTDRLNQPNTDSLPPAIAEQGANAEDVQDDDQITAIVSNNISSPSPLAVDVNDDVQVSSQDFVKMQQEMASIRSLLEHQVSGLMWQDMAQKDPQRAVLVNRLLALGLNEQIADQIAGYVPEQSTAEEAWAQATQLIAKQINTTQNDIITRGGVVALVGPTGVGKTTTIAKLAAGFSQVHGSDQVALISTDTFRIAGFEQLATYGKIIGCQVSLAKDSQALDTLLQQYSKKKLILIDTAGMGQRDIRLAEQLTALVANARVRIRNYLVLAANTQQGVMQENVDRFKKIPLSGCIYTKLDESISIGEIITTSIQNGLPIGYLTDGQRVPEDIKVANAEKLVTLADKMATKSVNNNVSVMRPMPVAPAAIV
ncbi:MULTISPECIES: flagellar biosynthesis protein FlhF [Colwellia]|uniref:Flagellar biosynthesis protein FlhF n=1 Tax=Colwellia marinimaniae TaxID=1513592 RepID=A0ABQ0MVD1_9GAMM|nr:MULTISPECIES: flagellar biosynthesis protein FlhF [Colwellia]GAW96309.1 flagellar biosynthesis regulator FlhF [Colwellia marinimaniae]